MHLSPDYQWLDETLEFNPTSLMSVYKQTIRWTSIMSGYCLWCSFQIIFFETLVLWFMMSQSGHQSTFHCFYINVFLCYFFLFFFLRLLDSAKKFSGGRLPATSRQAFVCRCPLHSRQWRLLQTSKPIDINFCINSNWKRNVSQLGDWLLIFFLLAVSNRIFDWH